MVTLPYRILNTSYTCGALLVLRPTKYYTIPMQPSLQENLERLLLSGQRNTIQVGLSLLENNVDLVAPAYIESALTLYQTYKEEGIEALALLQLTEEADILEVILSAKELPFPIKSQLDWWPHLGNFPLLRTIKVQGIHLHELLPSIACCTQLENLVLFDVAIHELPKEGVFMALKRLNLGNNLLSHLSEWLLQLDQLEHLAFDAALNEEPVVQTMRTRKKPYISNPIVRTPPAFT